MADQLPEGLRSSPITSSTSKGKSTENRQHVMGHISLLGYNGGIIAPMVAVRGEGAAFVVMVLFLADLRFQGKDLK